jgi:hypothetical protein
MRSRIPLSVVLVAMIALLYACSGRPTDQPAAVGDPSPAVTSSPSAGSASHRAQGTAGSQTYGTSPASKPKAGTGASKVTTHTATQTPAGQPPVKPPTPAPPAGPLRFGPIVPGTSYGPAIDISPDRRAFTLTFDALQIEVGNGEQTPAIVSRSYPLVVPLTGAARKATVEFHASGFIFADEDTTATLTLAVNGYQSVKTWSPDIEDDFVQTLRLPATPNSYRLSVSLQLRQRSGKPESTGHLDVVSIDAQIV